ncbi:hypothetical protein J421_5710 (plasmid) [Gemmatirosa kalamazoonensis]|uniref:Copper chaperone PCu(A)C n=1 Tax=Gemmatirosa kalamazoonensis TaxID=861299 RepID=W0RSH5_9BACT|nr:hypothetical protein [Gemmatirosa kalamazoonensis]AHG93245.1 hypothetical protein J421_5710 [Gemmatirosa kalamazoonensis]
MRHARTRRHALALTLAPAGALAFLAAAYAPTAPHRVRVVARDYAFEAADTVPGGDVSFELENRGAHFHELIVGHLRPGATGQDIVAAHQRGVTLRQLQEAYLADAAGGALLAQAGTRSPARLVMTLARGQAYVLLCQLRDTGTAPQHAVLGMFHLVHVR